MNSIVACKLEKDVYAVVVDARVYKIEIKYAYEIEEVHDVSLHHFVCITYVV